MSIQHFCLFLDSTFKNLISFFQQKLLFQKFITSVIIVEPLPSLITYSDSTLKELSSKLQEQASLSQNKLVEFPRKCRRCKGFFPFCQMKTIPVSMVSLAVGAGIFPLKILKFWLIRPPIIVSSILISSVPWSTLDALNLVIQANFVGLRILFTYLTCLITFDIN